jgi:hypothetical protein
MKLFHRSGAPSNTATRRPALVTHVDAPPQGAPHHGALSRGTIRVVVDLGSGPVEVAGMFRFADDHWLVRGMDVTVLIDPARPTEFDVDWSSVTSMADRVAANDPALADPFAAGRRVAQALGLTREDTGTRRQGRFAELMTAAAVAPPVAGKLHAVVLIASIRGRLEVSGSDPGPPSTELTVHRNSEAVLAVNVPGRPPYAVFVRSFNFPRSQSDIAGSGLPALVAATDPDDVEVQWDDVPSVAAQLADRMSASLSAAQDRMARQQSIGAQNMAAMQQVGAYPPAGPVAPAYGTPATADGRASFPSANVSAAMPTPGAGFAALTPQVHDMMIDNLRRTLRYIPDPTQRRLILDQYRALGVDVDSAGFDG